MIRMQALVGARQFDTVLGSRLRITNSPISPHFALHIAQRPPDGEADTATSDVRIGFIIAKKLSKQACRRNQIRRIWKATVLDALAQAPAMKADLVIRQKAPFDKAQFISASSPLLILQIQQEAKALLMMWQQQTQAPKLPKPQPKGVV
jgi:ribonuclease P protein component